jgi:predicted enzyme related to lactoylglutathione lyase
MSKRMYPVIHFEMPTRDNARARRFYENVFGWQITQLSPEMGDFLLAFTAETDPTNRMPRKLGVINGGFFKRTKPDEQTKVTILVDDIREVMKKVKAAGAEFLPGGQGGEPDDIPGVGLFATFIDTEGNRVTIYEDRSPNPTPEQRALLS